MFLIWFLYDPRIMVQGRQERGPKSYPLIKSKVLYGITVAPSFWDSRKNWDTKREQVGGKWPQWGILTPDFINGVFSKMFSAHNRSCTPLERTKKKRQPLQKRCQLKIGDAGKGYGEVCGAKTGRQTTLGNLAGWQLDHRITRDARRRCETTEKQWIFLHHSRRWKKWHS